MESNALAQVGYGVWLVVAIISLITGAILYLFTNNFNLWRWFWDHVWPDLSDEQQDDLVRRMEEYAKQNKEKKNK